MILKGVCKLPLIPTMISILLWESGRGLNAVYILKQKLLMERTFILKAVKFQK